MRIIRGELKPAAPEKPVFNVLGFLLLAIAVALLLIFFTAGGQP